MKYKLRKSHSHPNQDIEAEIKMYKVKNKETGLAVLWIKLQRKARLYKSLTSLYRVMQRIEYIK